MRCKKQIEKEERNEQGLPIFQIYTTDEHADKNNCDSTPRRLAEYVYDDWENVVKYREYLLPEDEDKKKARNLLKTIDRTFKYR